MKPIEVILNPGDVRVCRVKDDSNHSVTRWTELLAYDDKSYAWHTIYLINGGYVRRCLTVLPTSVGVILEKDVRNYTDFILNNNLDFDTL